MLESSKLLSLETLHNKESKTQYQKNETVPNPNFRRKSVKKRIYTLWIFDMTVPHNGFTKGRSLPKFERIRPKTVTAIKLTYMYSMQGPQNKVFFVVPHLIFHMRPTVIAHSFLSKFAKNHFQHTTHNFECTQLWKSEQRSTNYSPTGVEVRKSLQNSF